MAHKDALMAATTANPKVAPVYLVGAGPGDPGLLTLHALQAIEQAELIMVDALVSAPVRALIPKGVRIVEVGKRCGQHSMSQTQIEQQLIQFARQGLKVVRLKGGDAMVFGRVGEEMQALRAAAIPYQVIPGVTAASAASAYGAMPLTLRGVAAGVSFISGHQCGASTEVVSATADAPSQLVTSLSATAARGQRASNGVDWAQYVLPNHTLVIYMGLQQADNIAEGLLAAGMAPQTPLALVRNASLAEQVQWQGTLANLSALAEHVRQQEVQGPTILIIGEVVRQADALAWFNDAQNQTMALGASCFKWAM
ncbi:MAG: uroporphyrinogen-III C-methyltransferase [Ferrimonas sp.]